MMRNCFFIMLFISTFTFAQNKPTFGINAGGTYANVRGNESADRNEYDFNFLLGGSVEMPLSSKVSFLLNVNYERKTFQQDLNAAFFNPALSDPFDPIVTSEFVNIKVRLEYITIPLNLKYYLNERKNFFINGGPFVGVFLNSQSKANGTKINEDGNGLFKTLDFGGNFGIGTRFKINEKYSLNLEIRHNYGLANISSVPVINGGSIKTNTFNLIANWQFD